MWAIIVAACFFNDGVGDGFWGAVVEIVEGVEDGYVSVDAVCDLSTVSFSVVLDVVDFEGDGGGVLVFGWVEEGAVVVVAVGCESHNSVILYCCVCYCWLILVYRVRLFRLLRNASDTSLLLVMVFLCCLSRSASCALLVALLILSMTMVFSFDAILST